MPQRAPAADRDSGLRGAAEESLFGKEGLRGLPIGNFPSQFWANVYLNELDQFVKRELGVRHYLRYVDDMELVAESADQLTAWHRQIEGFLAERLGLALRRDEAVPIQVGRGVDFVGWKTWWSHRVPRRRTLGNLVSRVTRFERTALRPVHGGRARDVVLRPRVGSWPRGSAGVARIIVRAPATRRAGRAWIRLWREHPWLGVFFVGRQGWRLVERWPRAPALRAASFGRQYHELVHRVGRDGLVFCQVGQFIEFYGPQRALAAKALGLCSAWLPRAGYRLTAGFPARLLAVFLARALGRGYTVIQVRELDDPVHRGPKRREVVRVWFSAGADGDAAMIDPTPDVPRMAGEWAPRRRRGGRDGRLADRAWNRSATLGARSCDRSGTPRKRA